MALPRRSFLGLALPSALALAGCDGKNSLPPPRRFGAGATSPRRGGTLTFSIPDSPDTLDPAVGVTVTDYSAVGLLHDTLLDYAPALSGDPLKLVPQLAESWSCSADGTLYTFQLREGVTFSDGAPLTADDFVYSLDRLLSPETVSPSAMLFNGIAGAAARLSGKADRVAGLRAEGPKTLQIRLEEPYPAFPFLLTLRYTAPLKKAFVEAAGLRIRESSIGTGPFVLAEWKDGQRIVYDRNPRYWNPERPYLDRIRTEIYVPEDVSVLKFLRGEIDSLYQIGPDSYLRFAGSPAWRPYVFNTTLLTTVSLMLNTRRPPFNDKRVRQAMNYAINKDDIRRVANDRMIVANGYLPPGMPGHDPHRKPYPHDPERARRLLREAGYPDGFDLDYACINVSDTNTLAQSMQADLAEVGVRMRIRYYAGPAFYTALFKGDLLFADSSWWMDFPDPWNFLDERFHSSMIEKTNDSFYSSPPYDSLIERARREVDPQKRLSLYHEAEEILFDDCPNVFIGFYIISEVVAPYVKGYRLHPARLRSYRDTWLDEPARERS